MAKYRKSKMGRKKPKMRKSQKGFYRSVGYYGRTTGAELKFKDQTLQIAVPPDLVPPSAAITTSAVPNLTGGLLENIIQGTGMDQRIGRKIVVKSIDVKGFVGGTSASLADIVSCWLVLDKQANGTFPVTADIVQDNTVPQCSAQFNLTNVNRFRILKKWNIKVEPNAGVAGSFDSDAKPFSFHKKCSIPVEYSLNTGSVAEIRSNNLLMMFSTNRAAAATPYYIEGTTRVRFLDS